MGLFNIEAAAITHIGSVKTNNESNYYVNGKYKSDSAVSTDGIADKKLRNSYTYAVCEGIGGESYGELASLIAVATLEKFSKTNIRQTIGSYIKTVNEFICDLIRKNKKVRSGSTLALLNIQNFNAVSYNVGDSRVYFCRKGNLYLLSQENESAELSEANKQYLGITPADMNISAHVSEEINIKKGDVFLLCTAGVTDVLGDNDIVEFLSDKKDTAAAMAKKLAAASQTSKKDVTLVVIKAV